MSGYPARATGMISPCRCGSEKRTPVICQPGKSARYKPHPLLGRLALLDGAELAPPKAPSSRPYARRPESPIALPPMSGRSNVTVSVACSLAEVRIAVEVGEDPALLVGLQQILAVGDCGRRAAATRADAGNMHVGDQVVRDLEDIFRLGAAGDRAEIVLPSP